MSQAVKDVQHHSAPPPPSHAAPPSHSAPASHAAPPARDHVQLSAKETHPQGTASTGAIKHTLHSMKATPMPVPGMNGSQRHWFSHLSGADQHFYGHYLQHTSPQKRGVVMTLAQKMHDDNVTDPKQKNALRTAVLNNGQRLTQSQANNLHGIYLTNGHDLPTQGQFGKQGSGSGQLNQNQVKNQVAVYNYNQRNLMFNTDILKHDPHQQKEILDHEFSHEQLQSYMSTGKGNLSQKHDIATGDQLNAAWAHANAHKQATQQGLQHIFQQVGYTPQHAAVKAQNAFKDRQEMYTTYKSLYETGSAHQKQQLQQLNPQMAHLIQQQDSGHIESDKQVLQHFNLHQYAEQNHLSQKQVNGLQNWRHNSHEQSKLVDMLQSQAGASAWYRHGTQASGTQQSWTPPPPPHESHDYRPSVVTHDRPADVTSSRPADSTSARQASTPSPRPDISASTRSASGIAPNPTSIPSANRIGSNVGTRPSGSSTTSAGSSTNSPTAARLGNSTTGASNATGGSAFPSAARLGSSTTGASASPTAARLGGGSTTSLGGSTSSTSPGTGNTSPSAARLGISSTAASGTSTASAHGTASASNGVNGYTAGVNASPSAARLGISNAAGTAGTSGIGTTAGVDGSVAGVSASPSAAHLGISNTTGATTAGSNGVDGSVVGLSASPSAARPGISNTTGTAGVGTAGNGIDGSVAGIDGSVSPSAARLGIGNAAGTGGVTGTSASGTPGVGASGIDGSMAGIDGSLSPSAARLGIGNAASTGDVTGTSATGTPGVGASGIDGSMPGIDGSLGPSAARLGIGTATASAIDTAGTSAVGTAGVVGNSIDGLAGVDASVSRLGSTTGVSSTAGAMTIGEPTATAGNVEGRPGIDSAIRLGDSVPDVSNNIGNASNAVPPSRASMNQAWSAALTATSGDGSEGDALTQLAQVATGPQGGMAVGNALDALATRNDGGLRLQNLFVQGAANPEAAQALTTSLTSFAGASPDRAVGMALITSDQPQGIQAIGNYFSQAASQGLPNFFNLATATPDSARGMGELLTAMTETGPDGDRSGATQLAQSFATMSATPDGAANVAQGFRNMLDGDGGGRTIATLLNRFSTTRDGAQAAGDLLDNLSSENNFSPVLSRAMQSRGGAADVLDTLNRVAGTNDGRNSVSQLLQNNGTQIIGSAVKDTANSQRLATLLNTLAQDPTSAKQTLASLQDPRMQSVLTQLKSRADILPPLKDAMANLQQRGTTPQLPMTTKDLPLQWRGVTAMADAGLLKQPPTQKLMPQTLEPTTETAPAQATDKSGTSALLNMIATSNHEVASGVTTPTPNVQNATRSAQQPTFNQPAAHTPAEKEQNPLLLYAFRPGDVYGEDTLRNAHICPDCGFRTTPAGSCVRCEAYEQTEQPEIT